MIAPIIIVTDTHSGDSKIVKMLFEEVQACVKPKLIQANDLHNDPIAIKARVILFDRVQMATITAYRKINKFSRFILCTDTPVIRCDSSNGAEIQAIIRNQISAEKLMELILELQDLSIQNAKEELIRLTDRFVWNRTHHLLCDDSAEVKITKNEKILLDILCKEIGVPRAEETILTYFDAEGSALSPGTLKNLISNLRKKIPGLCLKNIYGHGYRLHVDQTDPT